MKRLSIALLGLGLAIAPATAQEQGATVPSGAAFITDPAYAGISDRPPNAQPGECYAQVSIPAKTRNVAKRVLKQEATDELIVREAEYRWTTKVVEIEAEAERLEIIPARYETQQREIVVEPAREEVTIIPATFKTVTEEVKVRESYHAWQPGTGPIQRYDHATGEIMCLCPVPAQFKTVERQVVDEPARVERTSIPAKIETFEVKVMIEPPRVRRVKIPAKTKEVKIREEVQPMRVTRRPIPAEYETILEEVNAEEGRVEWRPILCEINAKPGLIKQVQSVLEEAGFDPGPPDGALGRKTMQAIDLYQQKHGLARDFLTIETIEHMGIDPRV